MSTAAGHRGIPGDSTNQAYPVDDASHRTSGTAKRMLSDMYNIDVSLTFS